MLGPRVSIGHANLLTDAEMAMMRDTGTTVTTTRDVLAFATIEGARALGKADVTGSITVGKKADIVTMTTDDISVFPVVDPVSAIVYGGSRRTVTNVFVGGRRRKADGALVGVDTAALREAADRAAHDLIDRSGIGPSWRPSFA
jgi:cytosine/adenosine deaminase-related metal-dependent hydrolase